MKDYELTKILKEFLEYKRKINAEWMIDSQSPNAIEKLTEKYKCYLALSNEYLENYPELKKLEGRGLPLKTKESAEEWIDNFNN